MPINADKPHLWKADVEQSIDFYNDWFLRFAPATYREQRTGMANQVADALEVTAYLRHITPENLLTNPGILQILRMSCAPPLARDRLIGLGRLNKNLVLSMEGRPDRPPRIPPRMPKPELAEQLQRVCDTITELADRDLFTWLESSDDPSEEQVSRAATVVADRLCGAISDPIIRNAQEKRQLATLGAWLTDMGYENVSPSSVDDVTKLRPGVFAFRMNTSVENGAVNVPIDCVIQPHSAKFGDVPILIEAKSAGDATNTNKRRKEEAQKYRQLTARFGASIQYVLFLCGYFEPGYLGYEASEGIDWIWEHRLSDLSLLLKDRQENNGRVSERPAEYLLQQEPKEVQRYIAQREIDTQKTQTERNRMGQFSTPFILANEIVKYSQAVSDREGNVSFLEPALGSGVFFSAMETVTPSARVDLATGVELDADYVGVAARIWGERPFEVLNTDFVTFSALPDRQGLYNLLCTNPPYVRHHHLATKLKVELQQRIVQTLNLKPSGLSGLYVYFILLSHTLLEDEGVASWLIPSEFLAVNYGRVLREYLLKHVTLKRIHQFDPADVQFDDALVSSCIVTYVKRMPNETYDFEFSFGGSLDEPRQSVLVSSHSLSSTEKWPFSRMDANLNGRPEGIRLGDLLSVKRGIATGANGFFMVDRATIDEFSIPERFLKPILPSPRHLKSTMIRADQQGFPAVAGAKYLIDCDIAPDIVRRKYLGLWRYFELGITQGIPETYLCSRRRFWYLQEQRKPALYMATYMSRSRSVSTNPFRFFLNLSDAIGANVFLLLYPNPSLKALLDGNEDRMQEFLGILNGLAREQVIDGGRTYGGGLHKLEPRELANIRLTSTPDWLQIQTQPELALAW